MLALFNSKNGSPIDAGSAPVVSRHVVVVKGPGRVSLTKCRLGTAFAQDLKR